MVEENTRILIEEALKDIGWQANYAFPVASKENAYLMNLLSEVKVKARLLDEEAIEYRDKNSKLRTHLAMVHQERAMTEALLLERQKECDAKNHELLLAEREIGRITQELRDIRRQRGELSVRMGSLENEIFVHSNELNSIKSQMNYDQQKIDIYLDSCEEDVRLRERLATIQMGDESRLAALNSEAAKLSEKRRAVREKLDSVVSKNDVLRLRVGAASDQCRSENEARREVLQVWENCVSQMAKRDEDYAELNKEYNKMMDRVREEEEAVEQVKQVSALVNDDIKCTEEQIAQTNKEIWTLRCQLQKEEEEVAQLEEGLQTLQRQVERTENDFRSTMAGTKQCREELLKVNESLAQAEKKTEQAELTYQQVQDKRLNVEQLTKLAEEKLAKEEQCQKEGFNYQSQLTIKSLKAVEALKEANAETAMRNAAISGSRNTLRGLKRTADDREADLIKLDELIYKSQLFSQRLEHRIAKIEADPLVTQEEMNIKNQQLRELQALLESRNKNATTLTSMINQFMNDKRICKMRSEKLQESLALVQTQLDTAQLTMTNTNLALKKAQAAWQEMLVEYNMNRHQVDKMIARLRVLRDTVLSEETKQLQLDALEREVDVELSARMDKMEMEHRQADARLSETKSELTVRKRRLEQIKARYNITVTAIADTNEDAMSARMRYLLEALQERQDLKHKGDLLDVEVRRAEEELRALENTVVVMTSLNEVARGQSLSKAKYEPLLLEKQQLEEELSTLQSTLTNQRQGRRKLRASILHFELQNSELDKMSSMLRDRYNSALNCVGKAARAVEETGTRLDRVNKMLTQLTEKLDRFFRSNKADIEVRLLRDFNRLISQLYERCLHNSPIVDEHIMTREQNIMKEVGYSRPSLMSSHLEHRRGSRKSLTSRNSMARTTGEAKPLSVVSLGNNLPSLSDRPSQSSGGMSPQTRSPTQNRRRRSPNPSLFTRKNSA
ncbi:unnamed protein product [Calicophoron daubneyi]|uniref:Coiled-coil domain-containing protein 39 n=1 Tax=Calicophoron daubneyi TaxID=300641 RepID=A0AAV2TAC7_CALDB